MSSSDPPKPGSAPDGALTRRLAYAAYDVAGTGAALLAVLTAPWWLWRGLGRGLSQRLGAMPTEATRLDGRPLWIHAASVGEARAAAPLLGAARRQHPKLPIVLTTTTVTGRAVAETDLAPDVAMLLPVDALRFVDRAVARLRPCCVVVVETEIWPGLFRAAHRAGAGVIVASGRISPRSASRYRWLAPLMRVALGFVDRFGMQTEADAARIVALGAPPDRVQVTGSLKAGASDDARAHGDGESPLQGLHGRPLLIAASTQPGEEEFVFAAFATVRLRHPTALLLIAPRRPERFGEAEALIAAAKLSSQRRTLAAGSVASDTNVLLLDTVGELVRFFPLATAVFVGGTIAPIGGHNVLEPARFAKPVAFGPSLDNVANAAQELCREGAAVLVREPADLSRHWMQCLDEPQVAVDMGARALAVASAGSEVVERTWALIEPYLDDYLTEQFHHGDTESRR